MAIITLAEVKAYLGIATVQTDDDTLLATMILSAQSFIERETGKVFDAAAITTRYFTWGEDTGVHGNSALMLYLDEYLAEAGTVTNGDGVVVSSANYKLMPLNDPPYRVIRLTQNSGVAWTYTTSPEGAISVSGYWGWSKVAPADIKQIALRLVGFFYRQKDAQAYDMTGFSELGAIRVKHIIPQDITMMLSYYKELVFI
jgi:hypothetical protein